MGGDTTLAQRAEESRDHRDPGERMESLTLGAEQLRQQLDQLRALVALSVMQGLLRAVQEFCGEAFGQRVEYGVNVFALGQQLAGAFQLSDAQRFAGVMQILNDWYDGAAVDPV